VSTHTATAAPTPTSPDVAFERLDLDVNGTPTAVLAAGAVDAPPLVFFHGAGTWHGWGFAEPWVDQFRVLIPFHPGFGDSGDMDGLAGIDDYVRHYVELFDQLGLTADVNLVGLSLGGLIAARFAIEQKHRLRRLVLCCPGGLRVPEVDANDLFRIPPEELMGRLVHRIETLAPHLPADPHDVDFAVARYREARTVAITLWEHPFDRVVPRWLHRVDIPALVVWGENDRLITPAHARAWVDLLPQATLATFPEAGHLVLDESPEASAVVAHFCGDDK
jgi:pimeloyl-ACP methyl ester carboxylesterase